MKRPSHKQLIATCLIGTQCKAYIKRVQDSEAVLRTASQEFEVYAYHRKAYLFTDPTSLPQAQQTHVVSKADLITLYEQKLVQNLNGRKLYDKIKDTAADGFCQLCHDGLVETLDHYLPKEQFPSLSIAPFNLIPACLRCNKTKHTKIPSCAGEQTIHPHFDKGFYRQDWLAASIDQNTGVVTFAPGSQLDVTARQRVKSHLKDHGIDQLYSVKATAEVMQYARNMVKKEYPQLPDDARDGIQEQHTRLGRWRREGALTVKAWEIALCESLLEADWFWQGGYTRILASYADKQTNLQF